MIAELELDEKQIIADRVITTTSSYLGVERNLPKVRCAALGAGEYVAEDGRPECYYL